MSWELHTDRGRQTWHWNAANPQPEIPYNKKLNPNSADRVYRRQAQSQYRDLSLTNSDYRHYRIPVFHDDNLANETVAAELKAINFYQSLQMSDGHWPGDYGGPMFLLPGAVITCYITGVLDQWSSIKKQEMVKYLFNHQNDDGGWGLHIESTSTQFGTVMNYVALRLLGIEPSHPKVIPSQRFILNHGGAQTAPSWAKFWLCVLNVMDWNGYNSVFPELWLLPESVPIHPWRWWCHCRMVYLPMAYLYSVKFQAPITELITALRAELYTQHYHEMPWHKYRNECAAIDLYTPQTRIMKSLNFLANTYEKFQSAWLRRRASQFMLSYIEAEDQQTSSIDIGPVNKFVNMLCIYSAYGKNDSRFLAHVDRVDDYFWVAEDGMKCQGYNGSQLWDTAFATQAIVESGFAPLFADCAKKAYHYIDISQVQEDVKGRVEFYRHISKGGWPFSTLDHGWPITDCTAEGLKAALAVHSVPNLISPYNRIADSRFDDAVNVLLSFQNENGGWATYENQRAGGWMELINPAEVFSGIMVDYCYVECSSASVHALMKYQKTFPNNPRAIEITESVARGAAFLKSIQRADGSWYGSWAVCFTYGTWFGVEGLLASGESKQSPHIQRACQWLVSTQKPDGGWGESYLACVKKVYVEHKDSQIINTAWALLTLLAADYDDDTVIERGVRLILSRQERSGDFPQEGISGVFNGSCMITYTNYRNLFIIWALGRFIQRRKAKQGIT